MPIGAQILTILTAAGALLLGVALLARRRVAQHRQRAEAAEERARSYLKLLEGISRTAKTPLVGDVDANRASSAPPSTEAPRAIPSDSRYLFVSFEEEIRRARGRGAPLTLLTISLENAQASDAGDPEPYDRLLRGVALAVRGQMRGCDTCIRYAADEFILILPGVSREESRRVEARLRVAVHGVRYESPAGARLARARLGSATFPEDGATFDQILTLADNRRLQDGDPRRDLPPRAAPTAFRIPPPALSRN
ncbi:MAG TPA: diguanylate cyclase [Candidatus Polarisedimenticolia bacterium]|nr:diguanylate cyclase [Candidatus Polarisedimenticolia bacterium]